MRQFQITDGPSKFELMLALFDRLPGDRFRTVEFRAVMVPNSEFGGDPGFDRTVRAARIRSVIRQESEDWYLVGEIHQPSDARWVNFEGTYSTKSRSGIITMS